MREFFYLLRTDSDFRDHCRSRLVHFLLTITGVGLLMMLVHGVRHGLQEFRNESEFRRLMYARAVALLGGVAATGVVVLGFCLAVVLQQPTADEPIVPVQVTASRLDQTRPGQDLPLPEIDRRMLGEAEQHARLLTQLGLTELRAALAEGNPADLERLLAPDFTAQVLHGAGNSIEIGWITSKRAGSASECRDLDEDSFISRLMRERGDLQRASKRMSRC